MTTKEYTLTGSFTQNQTASEVTKSGTVYWHNVPIKWEVVQLPYFTTNGPDSNGETAAFIFTTDEGSQINKTGYTGKRNAIFMYRGSDNEHLFTWDVETSGYTDHLTLPYIPANAKSITFTWNLSPDGVNTAYCGFNIVAADKTRYYDSGWVKTGSITVNLEDYGECWLGINFSANGSTGDSSIQSQWSWADLNPTWIIEYDESQYKIYTTSAPASKNNEKSLQGADIFDGYFYQFYDTTGGCLKYDMSDLTAEPESISTPDASSHQGSVAFSNITSYTNSEGTTVDTQIPLIFETGHYNNSGNKMEIVTVADIENNTVVKKYEFPNRYDDCIAAWDWMNSVMWLIGYETESGYATTPWYIEKYSIDNLADADDTNYTLLDSYTFDITYNTLQDCKYKDGYVYILSGWGGTSNGPGTVWKLDVENRKIIGKIVTTDTYEMEGFAITDDYMYATDSGGKMLRFTYNFDEVDIEPTE